MDMTSNWNPDRLYKRVEMLHKGVVGCSTRELKDGGNLKTAAETLHTKN
jgi:hypothetical protein